MLEILGFLIGVQLTMTLLGSLYRIVDLAYRIADFWLDISARICLNLGLIFLVYFLIEGAFVTGFLNGQIFFGIFHVSVFWIGQLVVRLTTKN